MKRTHVSSLVLVLLISSALACTSHQQPVASTEKSSPPAAKNAAAAPAIQARAAAPGLAAPVRTGAGAERALNPAEAAARARASEQAKAVAAGGGPFSFQAVAFGESPAVRDLPPAATADDRTDEDRM